MRRAQQQRVPARGTLRSAFDVFIAAGRKAAQFVARTRRQLVAEFPYGDTPRYPEARAIAALVRDLFLNGEVDEVRFVATRFVNTLTQVATDMEFLPVGEIKALEIPGQRQKRPWLPIPPSSCSNRAPRRPSATCWVTISISSSISCS